MPPSTLNRGYGQDNYNIKVNGMTKEEIERYMGIPIADLADICGCKDIERLVTVVSLALNIGEMRGNTHTHEWYAKLFKGGKSEAI